MDPLNGARADGVHIDLVETPQGPGFAIQNPNAPGEAQPTDREPKRSR